MEKIGYLIKKDYQGVINKIENQISEWERNNLKVKKYYINFQNSDSRFRKVKLFFQLENGYNQQLLKLKKDNISLIYTRYDLFIPSFYKIIKTYPTIMEINSDDLAELKQKSLTTYLYNKTFRNKILQKVKGFVTVTNELKRK